jgi:hypothetical protein
MTIKCCFYLWFLAEWQMNDRRLAWTVTLTYRSGFYFAMQHEFGRIAKRSLSLA